MHDQPLRLAVFGFDGAMHRLDIAPRCRQPDPEGSAFPATAAGREIAIEDLIELRRHARPVGRPNSTLPRRLP